MTKRKTIFVILCAVLIFVSAVSGCSAANMRKINGNYELTKCKLNLDSQKYKTQVDGSGDMSITGHTINLNLWILTDSTVDELDYTYMDGDGGTSDVIEKYYFVSAEIGSISSDIESVKFYGDLWEISFDDTLYEKKYSIVGENGSACIQYVNFYFTNKDAEELRLSFNLYFSKKDKSDDNNGGNSNKPVPTTKFEKIKKAYADAGYGVDIENSLDDETKAAIELIKNNIEAIGCKIGYIGKGIGTTDIELYMIVGTETTEQADQLEQTFASAYKYRRSGKDLIFFMNPYGTPNFDPFVAATS